MIGFFRKKKITISFESPIKDKRIGRKSDLLLKEATKLKKDGDIEGAIRTLRLAYKEIEKGDAGYSIRTYLRLPLYLQKANRNDEAWHEYNRLITSGYPNQSKNPEIIPMDQSLIYDKMRLFLQKEGKNNIAITYGILSYISWCLGLYHQGRIQELNIQKSREHIEQEVKPLLKKAKCEEKLINISDYIEKQLNLLPNISLYDIAKEVERLRQ
jgi:hypothetical protein